MQFEVAGTAVAGNVLGDFKTGQAGEPVAPQDRLDLFEPGARLRQELAGSHRVAQRVRPLAVEPQASIAGVQAGPHPVAALGRRQDGRSVTQRHAADAAERVPDDLGFQRHLPFVGDVRIHAAAAAPVERGGPAIVRRRHDVDRLGVDDARATGQLADATHAWIDEAEAVLRGERGVAGVEISENVANDQRGVHIEPHDVRDIGRMAALREQLGGLTHVVDAINGLTLRRDARAFFQGNRYLLGQLVEHVTSHVADGAVVDLYAGVGLFGLSLAARGAAHVLLVEGDPIGGADLQENARPFGDRVRVERRSVESVVAAAAAAGPKSRARTTQTTYVVDPPRTGMSKEALAGIVQASPERIVYVSCDPATLARDTRTLLDAGYSLEGLTGFDLFPNTAHVESVARFGR